MQKPVLKPQPAGYVPAWTGVFETWSRAWVSKHFWRVQHMLPDEQDALQECALVWSKCARAYTGKVDNPAWFMALFKTSVARHWITLSNRDSEAPERFTIEQEPEDFLALQAEHSAGPLAAALAGASAELRQFIVLIASSPAEMLGMLLEPGPDAEMGRRIRRLTGIYGDLIGELRGILGA
jgi:hypothetical protein